MTEPSRNAARRRAVRLMAAYPRVWRERYGEEFLELLVDDIVERPRSLSRTADVIASGVRTRLSQAGLTGDLAGAEAQTRSGLAVTGLALAAFLTVGIAIWSQLSIGWQWSAPRASGTTAAMIVMSAVVLVFAGLAVLAAAPVAWSLARTIVRAPRLKLVVPLALAVTGATVLALGSIHFGHGWPGTGGHERAGRDLVPGAVARFCWAATLWVTSYWAHPGALSAFPTSEVVWMTIAPAALLAVVLGSAAVLRQLPLSHRVLRYESCLAGAAALAMAVFLAGASDWIVSGGPDPYHLFRAGTIDVIAVLVMAAALIAGFGAVRRALRASRTSLAAG